MRDHHSKDHLQFHVQFDTRVFHPSLLEDETALEDAVCALESYLGNPAADVDALCGDLLCVPHLFGFAVSILNDSGHGILRKKLLRGFPSTAHAFLISAVRRVIDEVSLFLLSEAESLFRDQERSFKDCRHTFELTCLVLEDLHNSLFPDQPLPPEYHDSIKDRTIRASRSGRQRTQTAVDDTRTDPSKRLNIEMPSSREQKIKLVESVLTDMSDFLQYLLGFLRDPQLSDTIMKTYVTKASDLEEFEAFRHEHASIGEAAALAPGIETSHKHSTQTLSAALYLDNADGLGIWRILVTNRTDNDLRRAYQRNSRLLDIIVAKIRDLSNGHFTSDNQTLLTDTENGIPIYEAKLARNARLVYYIDCVLDYKDEGEQQAIKVLGIYSHTLRNRHYWNDLSSQLGRSDKEYIRRCTDLEHAGGQGERFVPASFPSRPEVSAPPTSEWLLPQPTHLDKLQEVLIQERYTTLSQQLLDAIRTDIEFPHYPLLTWQEKQILDDWKSCYVIGRSGTGKTTTMILKILAIERCWQEVHEALTRPRQMFVTKNYKLTDKVRKEYHLYRKIDLFSEDRYEPLYCTDERGDDLLVNRNEETQLQQDLPRRFRDLQDQHFPLFVNFDQLCRLLEANFGDEESADAGRNLDQCTNSVSYEVFCRSYWAHFPQQLVKGLDPALVFGEFMGVIKGSELALNSNEKCLDKETYLSLSQKSYPTYAAHREIVYDLFIRYTKRKAERREYDAADRTRCILDNLIFSGLSGKPLDYIYVDEVQDHLLIDTLLLRAICNNPGSGLFWAGDTAQTISVGSSFRFNDLRAMMYRVEQQMLATQLKQQRCNRPTISKHCNQPKIHQLTVNHRSHTGIVDCAHTIIELLVQFWPTSIDQLARERGLGYGTQPIYYRPSNTATDSLDNLVFGEPAKRKKFGPQQCILVRDEDVKERLPAQIKDAAMIMTILESKGQEFDDVLLYEFFADSEVDIARWRLVLHALPNQKAPEFNLIRHSGVCRDLKSLYVAITRARKRLWIVDDSSKGDSMRTLWTSRGLIKDCVLDVAGTIDLANSQSTFQDWVKKGDSLFHDERYEQAKFCYCEANREANLQQSLQQSLQRKIQIANAYYLRQRAHTTPIQAHGKNRTQVEAFSEAGIAFRKCGNQAITQNEERIYYRIAADCFFHAENLPQAAQTYIDAAEYSKAALLFRQTAMFDEAVDVINSYEHEITHNIVQGIMDVARAAYLRGAYLKRSELCKARSLCRSENEMLSYADKYGFWWIRAHLLECDPDVHGAAALYLAENQPQVAVQLFLASQATDRSLHASQYLLHGLRWHLSFGIDPQHTLSKPNEVPVLKNLIQLLSGWDVSNLPEGFRDELLMFRALAEDDTKQLLKLGLAFIPRDNFAASAFRCLHHAYSKSMRFDSLMQLASHSDNFLLYVRRLRTYAAQSNPSALADIQHLYGFIPPIFPHEQFLVRPNTLLYLHASRSAIFSKRTTEHGIALWEWELDGLIQQNLRGILSCRVTDWVKTCQSAITPCRNFGVEGQCIISYCNRKHPVAFSYDQQTYNLRIRVHLQQIIICQMKSGLEGRWRHMTEKLAWLRRFHNALIPNSHKSDTVKLTDLKLLQPNLIPDYASGLFIVQSWIREILCSLTQDQSRAIFGKEYCLNTLLELTSMALIFDEPAFRSYIHRIPLVTKPAPLSSRLHRTCIIEPLIKYAMNVHEEPILCLASCLSRVTMGVKDYFISIDVLCDIVDEFCALLILERHYYECSSLHDVILPHRWLIRAVPRLRGTGIADDQMLLMFISVVDQLLEQLSTGLKPAYLSPNLTPRNSVARICTMLVLLGINLRYEQWLQNIILRLLSHTQHPHWNAQKCSQNNAKWQSLELALYELYAQSEDGDLVGLVQEGRTTGQLPNRITPRPTVFKEIQEIPKLLGCSSPLMASSGYFAPSHPEETKILTRRSVTANHSVSVSSTRGIQDGIRTRSVRDQVKHYDYVAPISNRERGAGKVILRAYLQYRHRTSNSADELDRLRRLHFSELSIAMRKAPMAIKGSNRLFFSATVPHLLVCLDGIAVYATRRLSRLRKRLRNAHHLELDQILADLNTISSISDDVTSLKELLRPKVPAHEPWDLKWLRETVIKVEQLGQRVPPNVQTWWESDIRLAKKAVEPKRSVGINSAIKRK